jgi:outer membrane protein assembly factor BamB
VAATTAIVVVSGRDVADTRDEFRGYEAATGKLLWTLTYPAAGPLDYGSAPRATPLLNDKLAFLLGAYGHLHAVELATGKVVWKLHLPNTFGPLPKLPWGLCESPLLAGDKLIVHPGGERGALVALEPATGKVIWQVKGRAPGHGSLIIGTFGGREQLVGHDVVTLGGWDPATGERLWEVRPPRGDDFNVPTPMAWKGKVVVCTENNGTRLFGFDAAGKVVPKPEAVQSDLSPDMHSPVVVGDHLFGVHANQLCCYDLTQGLKSVWEKDDDAFSGYASLIASDKRLLVTNVRAEIVLVDVTGNAYRECGRRTLVQEEAGLYSHPAIVGDRLYVRASDALYCVGLGG